MPLLILAGSDRRAGPVPAGLSANEMLAGLKGALPLPWGRCLAAEAVERFRRSGQFEEPILLGPQALYRGKLDCEIVDVTGPLAVTLGRALKLMDARFDGDLPLAVATCDILPTPAEIRELLDTAYAPLGDCCFWWQLVTGEAEHLGASAWKPHYGILDDDGRPRTVYPGHLVILRPGRLRLELLSRLLAAAYRSRNRTLRQRFLPMLIRGVGLLVRQDVQNLARRQPPTLTFAIPWHILRAYFPLRRRRLTLPEFERRAAHVLVHRRFRRSGRPVVIAATSIASFAKDIDTLAELQEAIGRGPV